MNQSVHVTSLNSFGITRETDTGFSLSHVADLPKSHLENHSNSHHPVYLKVGLWGYCEGKPEKADYTFCSNPSTSFSFNPWDTLGSVSEALNGTLQYDNTKLLKRNNDRSKWSIGAIWAYIVGFISTVLAFVFGVTFMTLFWGKALLIISSVVSPM
jgi:hypothetical protein